MKTNCQLLCVLLVTLFMNGCGADPAEAETARATGTTGAADLATASVPSSDSQAARDAIASMLKLAEAGDWATYVDQFYGESHKFGGPEDQAKLVNRFETSWGEKILPALRVVTTLTPTIDAEGRAVFTRDGATIYMLYKHKDGRWTFHL